MAEQLQSASLIHLFGRQVEDLTSGKVSTPGALPTKAATQLLASELAAPGACLARIYAFSFEGAYCELAKPALFVVHGPGTAASKTVEWSGLAATPNDYSTDLMVWACDKSDMSLRMDVETGTFQQILLEFEAGGRAQFAGQMARFSGQMARFSGQMARTRGRGSSGDE